MANDNTIAEIKERLNIVDVVADFVQLKKAGANFKGLCPFHGEKTPSFVVTPGKQIWYCFGCNLGGDIFEFIKQIENVDFAASLKILADRAGVQLRPQTPEEIVREKKKGDLYEINDAAAKYYTRVLWESDAAKDALAYLKKRGLTDRTIENWRLGWAPDDFHYLENFLVKKYAKDDIEEAGLIIKKDSSTEYFDRFRGRIMFPILNIHGQVVGFTGRLLHENSHAGKYINSPETPIYNKSRELYGLYQAKNQIRKDNRCLLMEGNMDVISSHQAGSISAVASSGTALSGGQLEIIRRFCDHLVFAFDADAAGSQATRRALELALNLGFSVKIVDLKEAKDPDELIGRGIGVWQKAVDHAANFVDYFFEKTFKQFDLSSVDDKREVVKILTPLVYRISEPVTRAHYIRKLALGINVAERSIWDIINRLNFPKPQNTPDNADIRKKSRREVLTEQLLGLTLVTGNNHNLQEFRVEDFDKKFTEIIRALLEASPTLEQLTKKFPQLSNQFELLNFATSVSIAEEDLNSSEELVRVSIELKRLIVKQNMAEVSAAMAVAEQAKNKELIDKLSLEFSRLSQQFRELN